MSLAEQIDTLEHDHAAALAQIDALTAANAALSSANASLQRDNVALQLEVNDAKHYVDDTRSMAESLARSAYDMLRASRRQVGPWSPPEVIPFAKHSHIDPDENKPLVLNIDGVAPVTGPNFKVDPTGRVVLLDTPAQQAVAEIMQGDSGDEQPMTDSDLEQAMAEGRKHFDATVAEIERTPVPINSFAPQSLEPIRVEHDENDLPVFLQRSTPFDAAARAQVFG